MKHEYGGTKSWEEHRDAALPLMDNDIGVVAGKHDLKSAHGKSEAVQEIAPFIRELGDAVQRAHYIQRVASVARVTEEAVQEAVGRTRFTKREPRQRPILTDLETQNSDLPAAEEHLLSLVLRYPQ